MLLLDAVALLQGLLRQLSGSLLTGKPMRCGIGIELCSLLICEIEGCTVFLRRCGHGCSFLRYAKVSEAALMCHWFVARISVAAAADLEP